MSWLQQRHWDRHLETWTDTTFSPQYPFAAVAETLDQTLPFPNLSTRSDKARAHPGLGVLGQDPDLVLVDVDAQPGAGQHVNVPILDVPDLGVLGVAGQVLGARVVVDAQAHLLDGKVGTCGDDLAVGRQGDGPQRAVRRQGDVVGLGHGRDALHLGDAADVGNVGLQEVDAAGLEEGLDVPPAVQSLAQRDGHARLRGQGRNARQVLRQERLLDEQGPVGLQEADQLLRHGLMHAPVEVDAHVHAQGLNGLDTLDARVEGGGRVEPAHVLGGVHLDTAKALIPSCLSTEPPHQRVSITCLFE